MKRLHLLALTLFLSIGCGTTQSNAGPFGDDGLSKFDPAHRSIFDGCQYVTIDFADYTQSAWAGCGSGQSLEYRRYPKMADFATLETEWRERHAADDSTLAIDSSRPFEMNSSRAAVKQITWTQRGNATRTWLIAVDGRDAYICDFSRYTKPDADYRPKTPAEVADEVSRCEKGLRAMHATVAAPGN
jgi:hypothetical protein